MMNPVEMEPFGFFDWIRNFGLDPLKEYYIHHVKTGTNAFFDSTGMFASRGCHGTEEYRWRFHPVIRHGFRNCYVMQNVKTNGYANWNTKPMFGFPGSVRAFKKRELENNIVEIMPFRYNENGSLVVFIRGVERNSFLGRTMFTNLGSYYEIPNENHEWIIEEVGKQKHTLIPIHKGKKPLKKPSIQMCIA